MTISTISIELLIIEIIVSLIFIFATGKYERPEVVKSRYALGTIINFEISGSLQ